MAASVKDTGKENIDTQVEEDDIRGDGKKKKFKPLSAVRKFFGGKSKRKKDDGVVAVKAQSTTALHSTGYDDDDEEDDGGFKSHPNTGKPLVGTRSISEDSIFSPEPRDQPASFPKVAVSEERLPKSNFQSELFSKLNKRRSQYSDDDQDEGIPRSPVPVLTTADVVAEPLKPLTFGKKHSGSTRDSEQSLISVDGSDMEDDLFTTKWKTSVPSRKLFDKPRMSDSSVDLETMDFSSIEKTEVLKSTAAKDRISIKPQYRRASRLSRKKKESSLSKSLPCLNEESPTRPKVENLSKTTNNKNAMFEDIDISQLDPKEALPITKEKASDSVKSSLSSSAPGKSQDITRIAVSSQSSGANVVATKSKDENNSMKDKEKKVGFSDGDNLSTKAKINDLASNFGGGGSASPSLKVSDPDSDVTMSPREGYKIKRQNRSKTLPTGNIEEDISSKIQRASSHRAPVSNSPPEEKSSGVPVTSSVRRLGTTRFSQFESSNTSSEPSWVNKAKQKKLEQTGSEEQEQKKTSSEGSIRTSEGSIRRQSHENILASASTKSNEPAISQPKNVPSSSPSSKDVKKGSIDVNNSKVIDSENDKTVNTPPNSLNSKRSSIDISSTKRESIDIDIKELSSIKQRTASFNSTGKVESTPPNKTNSVTQDATKPMSPTSSTASSSSPPASLSMAERAKLFSGSKSSSSSSSGAPPSSSKPPSGIGHLRSGSVKTSPTKSSDSSTPINLRAGSVKGTSFSSSSSSNFRSDSSSSTSSTVKRDTPDNSSVTKPSNLVSSANSKFSSSSNSNTTTAIPSSQQTPSSHKPSSQSSSTPSTSFSKTTVPAGRAFSSLSSSAAKPPTTTPSASASNVSKSNQQVSLSSSSSSASSTNSPASKPSSKTQSSPIRSHASFTATSPFRPQLSSNSPSLSSRSTALSKSTSMKVSSPAPAVTKVEEKKKEATTTATTTTAASNVPAWRANLQKKDVKIEIIEKKTSPTSSPSSTTNQTSQSKNENKFGNSSRVTEMAKVFQVRD